MSETLPLLSGSGPINPPPPVGTPQPGRPGAKGANTVFADIVAGRAPGGGQATFSGGSEVAPVPTEDGKDLPQSLPGSQYPELLAEQTVLLVGDRPSATDGQSPMSAFLLGGDYPSGTDEQSPMPDSEAAPPQAVFPTVNPPQSVEVDLLARLFSGQPVEKPLPATLQVILSTVDAGYGRGPVAKPAPAISQAIGSTTEPGFGQQPVEKPPPVLLPVIDPATEPKFTERLPGQPLPAAVNPRTTVPDSVLPGVAEAKGEFTAPKTGLVEILAAVSRATPENAADGRWPTSLAGLAGSTAPAINPVAGPAIAGTVPVLLEGRSGVPLGNSPVHTPLNQAGWDQAVGQRVLWLVNQNVQTAQIQLNPPQLGPLEVHISVHEGKASLLFTSQQSIVREALEAALPRLREVFSDQGLNLTNVDISQHSFAQRREPAPGGTGGPGQSHTDPRDADELPDDEWSAGQALRRGLVDYYV